jgi:hypothetical protein
LCVCIIREADQQIVSGARNKRKEGIMPAKIELFPGRTTTYAKIQDAVDRFDEVLLHPRDAAGTPNLKFDIGPNRILVTKPTTIKGVRDPRYPDEKPVITGTSGWLIFANAPDGYPGAGIFSVVTKGDVEITNLYLEHTPDPNPQGISMHGSATLAYFAYNDHRSHLKVTDCDLITAATSGISLDAFNAISTLPERHDITVRGCTITGVDQPAFAQYGAGNFIGVKLGAMLSGRPPLDMRDSRFQVTQCQIDSARWAGVTGAFFESDEQSEFMVSKNKIGYYPHSPLEVTRVGVIFLNASVLAPALESWPKGKITVSENDIRLQGYFNFPWPDWSAGILINVNSALPERSETSISRNRVSFYHQMAPQWPFALAPSEVVLDGIIYQDDPGDGSAKVKAVIEKNTVISAAPVMPLRGIFLRKAAHHVRVTGNDLRNLTASHAQVFIDSEAHGCELSGNLYGGLERMQGNTFEPVAVVLCDGDRNNLSCDDFSGSGVPGWDNTTHSGGPGRVKLDSNSDFDDVRVDPATFVVTPQNTVQWWDVSGHNSVHA